MSDIEQKWRSYPRTILEFDDELRARIDLRRALSPLDFRALARLGLTEPFAVLTAQNPEGEHAEDAAAAGDEARQGAQNAARESALELALADRGLRFRRVDALSADESYREQCVAIIMKRAPAVRLAEELRQIALFWFDGAAFWLLPAEASARPVRLPRPEDSRHAPPNELRYE